jgi:hypothetical protein
MNRAKVMDPTEISLLSIDLHIAEKPSLFILLAADGSINRLGDGPEDCRDMCIGLTTPEVFLNVRNLVTAAMLEGCGCTYSDPDIRGLPCKLVVLFRTHTGTELGLRWVYGSRSAGPHPEVIALVKTAMELTEPWYRRMVPAPKPMPPRPWWKDWKDLNAAVLPGFAFVAVGCIMYAGAGPQDAGFLKGGSIFVGLSLIVVGLGRWRRLRQYRHLRGRGPFVT